MDFKKINFGKADAYTELNHFPQLLDKGFLNEERYIEKILEGEKFFIVGDKGSGKSEIACKLKRMSILNDELFVNILDLEEFPFKPFSQIIPNTESETKRKENWKFLLLLTLLGSFSEDLGCESKEPFELSRTNEILEELGISPKNCLEKEKLHSLVKQTARQSFSAKLKLFEYKYEKEKEETPQQFTIRDIYKLIEETIFSIESPSKHILFVDGLDTVLNQGKKQLEITLKLLTSLIKSAKDLNDAFSSEEINAKIAILCRMDLMNKFWDSNINKIFQDSRIPLNWSSSDLHNSNLIKLINLRGKLSLNRDVDVIPEFFPQQLGKYVNKDAIRSLLEFTRENPRDFIQLMNYIQNNAREGSEQKIALKSIWAGIYDYSRSYFKGEIINDVVGFLDQDSTENIFEVIEQMGVTKFHLNDVEAKVKEIKRYEELNLTESFRALYECGGIGNYHKKTKEISLEIPKSFFTIQSRHVHCRP